VAFSKTYQHLSGRGCCAVPSTCLVTWYISCLLKAGGKAGVLLWGLCGRIFGGHLSSEPLTPVKFKKFWHSLLYILVILTSPQSNSRTARRSSADKTISKLPVLHSSRMLTPPLCESNTAAAGGPIWEGACVFSSYIFADEFRVYPHFDLEPDYIIRKGI